ncbi:hypothetical protein Calkro_0634 [Caldicellulosiruptor kronotskyensis 2002]|uniref:Uncharacterized protein n=1 Tax=Caldicellulosiruptor kronotskyensis (strain DSM 18902 / VKM B-2412 / 2002) TaxID=632348 RepID=E4SEP1_CALK2|nr:hypothetical protein [Caldicellulosiruptor kronotskyensis]ADQ45528.1 hypothetical protein Calkro_0634 [Caldicellulosiruptor kronotskyensis 2002]
MKKKIIYLLYTFVAMLHTVPVLANSNNQTNTNKQSAKTTDPIQTVQGYFKTAGVTQKDPGNVAANVVKDIIAPIAAIVGFVGLIAIAVWFFAKIMTAKDARERSEAMSNFSWKLIGAIGLCLILTVGGFLVWLLGKLGTI